MTMQIGLIPATGAGVGSTPQYITDFVGAAEAGGFDSVWMGEHPALPVHPDVPYPGSGEGVSGPSREPLPDPIDWLVFAAARTTTLLLGTAVLLAPLHSPAVLAKRVATLDQVSGGRFRLGLGMGWSRQEYVACGATWETRAKRLDETIEALRVLWSQEEATYTGETFSFEPVHCLPKPRSGSVPILIGSSSLAGARRAGRLGDGFLPFDRDPEKLATSIAEMRRAAEAAGRDPDAIEITALGGVRPERIAALARLGVSRMLLYSSDPSALADLGARMHDVIASVS
ncbi:MAG: LLM class F420-dependent oxidoreductase [Acidimicrobiia bacterium]